MNKKGQTPADAILGIVFLFGLAIAGVLSFYMFGQVFNHFENSTMNSTVTYPIYEKGRAVNAMWDYIILTVLIGVAIAVVILGYFIDVHSIFMVLYIIGLLVGVVVTWILSYVWEQFAAQVPADIATIITVSFPITNGIMNNLPLLFTCVGALGMVATYAKVNQ